MTLYGVVVFIHIMAAICGLGAVFANPSIMKRGTTVSKAKQALETAKDVEKYAKIGSIALLITGLLLGVLNPSLFTEGWYITALVLYIAVQPIVAYMIPKRAENLYIMLEKQESDTLPDEFMPVAMQIAKLDNIARASVFILILLMSLKPF
ncbi:DUF2269 family protein [Ammoniphilus sp. YIM 78166]|uniref:DUF2269 family protein n=1 Tax=Ammoniphilus sp. YIM 78166 TaxID=1644106 RepID=UPI0010701AC5|nr:DUF2269 family protein [Ammoniphilus sp. YIM 78166]